MSTLSHHGLVDWHAHFFPVELADLLSTRAGAPRIVRSGEKALLVGSDGEQHGLGSSMLDIEARTRELDAAGIAHQVLSLPGLMGIDTAAEDAVALVGAFNEGISRLVASRPDRFSALALVPLARPDAAPAILADALDRLGLAGVILPTAAFRDEETAAGFAPLLVELDARGGHLFVHPGPLPAMPLGPISPESAGDSAAAIRKGVLGIQNALSAAAVTLEFTPFLDAFPRIDVHLANLAGALPFLAERIAHGAARYGVEASEAAGRRKRIRVDTASFGPRAIALAAQVFGPERILFGTDAPIFAVTEALHALRDSGVVPTALPPSLLPRRAA